MKTKVCTKCKKRKLLKYFYKDNRYQNSFRSICKVCCASWQSKHNSKYVEQFKLRRFKYYQSHKKEILKQCKKYRKKNHKRLSRLKKIYKKNVLKFNLENRLADRLRTRLWKALKGIAKSTSTLELLGCSVSQLIQHLEKQFKKGMTWKNYGKWHVDHIKPLSFFDLTKSKQQRLACNYKNLQPLWASENLQKNNKI